MEKTTEWAMFWIAMVYSQTYCLDDRLSTNQFGCVARGYPITHATFKISLKGIQWVDTDASDA